MLCKLTAQGALMPSSSLNTTSDGTPRIVDVIGATVTVASQPMEPSRVSTTTGLLLSGGANSYIRTSPRAIRPATQFPHPTDGSLHLSAAASDSLPAHALPWHADPTFADARAEHPSSARSGCASSAVPPDPPPATTSYREQPGSFPYVDSTPQSTPHPLPAVTPPSCRW